MKTLRNVDLWDHDNTSNIQNIKIKSIRVEKILKFGIKQNK
jgi:hypothetical protein